MTDHRAEIDRLLMAAGDCDDMSVVLALATLAQVHATLAQTAAMERIARQGLSTPVLGGRI